MSAAAKLRALRESLPDKPGVRAVAALLGYDMPNTYGYYESGQFKRDTLPLAKAREFAPAFVALGGRAEDVLALAGLTDTEQASEAKTIPAAPVRPSLMLPVSLPDHETMTRMMEALLEGFGLDEAAEKHAEGLARQLPSALARAVNDPASFHSDRAATQPAPIEPDSVRTPARPQ